MGSSDLGVALRHLKEYEESLDNAMRDFRGSLESLNVEWSDSRFEGLLSSIGGVVREASAAIAESSSLEGDVRRVIRIADSDIEARGIV